MEKAAKKPAPPALEAAKLRLLIDEIGEKLGHRTADLMHKLQAEEGLKLRFAGGTHVCALAGVVASCTEGEAGSLRTWANAARRALLKAGVA